MKLQQLEKSRVCRSYRMNVGRKIIIMMLISGALAGIAGAGWMLSDQLSIHLVFRQTRVWLGWYVDRSSGCIRRSVFL